MPAACCQFGILPAAGLLFFLPLLLLPLQSVDYELPSTLARYLPLQPTTLLL
ncbi:predicted protein [Plenodomus lingam JN3]|uniref:Predicted protein n=1 Tax=Leptosphaeria maculans (strain JN3 / isolate v23.1.3 / race Av1-4-5-6-7-8) TaxID=985895 RepID=E4ZZZ5_LEPMJ|nr:predicted protein [Plenodomus lingam JN3]CBX96855.1 predicted protein [Plenodomus lingam JN3]